MTADSTERGERLWMPVVAPIIWAVHFTVSYVTVAMACGRFGGVTPFGHPRLVVGIYSVVAIAAMAALFVHGFSRHQYTLPDRPNDDDTPEDRRRFVAFTTMLLAGLSVVATVYAWFAIVIVSPCA